MERAFALNPTDARVLFELDLLKKRARVGPGKRFGFLKIHRNLVEAREDLLVEFITLLNFFGWHQEALGLLLGRKFHPWEGGEGKVTGQYVTSLRELAKGILDEREALSVGGGFREKTVTQNKLRGAIELLERAREYPPNLGEGKLHGALENQILFWLGAAHERAGEKGNAKQYFEEACEGMKAPSPAVYYNDQNPENIFYQGLAWRKLGRESRARERYETLVDFGKTHRNDHIVIDYFAVSLPEFMVFDDDLDLRNEINCRYLMALGLWGLGKRGSAFRELKTALRLDPSHLAARLHLQMFRARL